MSDRKDIGSPQAIDPYQEQLFEGWKPFLMHNAFLLTLNSASEKLVTTSSHVFCVFSWIQHFYFKTGFLKLSWQL